MASKLTRAEAARINGAKSRGPTSPEGKARSSQNAVKHGLTAKKFMVQPADQQEFDLHLNAAIRHWNPQTDYELYLVTKLARAEFLHDRAEAMQTSLIDLQTGVITPDILEHPQPVDDTGASALGYKWLNDNSSAHRNLDRHIARLARERVQAVKNLQIAMAARPAIEAPAQEPEPAASTAGSFCNASIISKAPPRSAPAPAPTFVASKSRPAQKERNAAGNTKPPLAPAA